MFHYIVALGRDEKFKSDFLKNWKDDPGKRRYITIANAPDLDSIAKKYNLGVEKLGEISCDDFVVFVHEDVILPEDLDGMEKSVAEKMRGFDLGGVIGSTFNGGGNWYFSPQPTKSGSVVLFRKDGSSYDFKQGPECEVANLDGLVLFCTARLVRTVSFDDRIPGYHAYDASYCLRARKQGYKLRTMILPGLAHNSTNNFPFDYIKSVAVFNNLYREYLPDFVAKKPG